ncbi:MAG: hypothetical protein KDD89_13050 [Anaerolineales bacterium]|nr:hypothetical protein [Anaerolineales bacterium]
MIIGLVAPCRFALHTAVYQIKPHQPPHLYTTCTTHACPRPENWHKKGA